MFVSKSVRRRSTVLLVLLSLLPGFVGQAQAATDHQCFTETGQCLRTRFFDYWRQSGGLPVFGFPITIAADEQNRDTGQTYVTQWMERNRFELHPENKAPYDVLLGRLGDDRLQQLGTRWQTLPKASPGSPHYFAASGQAIAHEPFWRYWSSHGLELGDGGVSERESLALFGLPISPPRTETNSSGDTVLTQWFERARFEDHGSKGVLLGLLGNEVFAVAGATLPRSPIPAPEPAPIPPTLPVPPAPSFNNCQTDERAFLADNYPVRIVAVDKVAEVVIIKNVSNGPVNMSGWRLCSINDSQEQLGIGGLLQPGQQASFSSGGDIWSNNERDDGVLYNAQGSVISFYEDTKY